MRTAVISDLHLGTTVCADLARDSALRKTLLAELSEADRVVLLGDALELRDLPAGEILDRATLFLQQLGAALGGGEVVLVPGNHDHRLAEHLLEGRALDRRAGLGLEQRFEATSRLGVEIARRLQPASLSFAYPGLWVRDDVWAMHGHYMDCHMTIPTVECLTAAATMRIVGTIPEAATPDDYEHAIGPIYGFAWAFAQARGPQRLRGGAKPSTVAWRRLSGDGSRPVTARLLGSVAFPLAARGLGRAMGRRFDTDISVANISHAGLAAIREAVGRLGIEADHVLFGHTHRPGPLPGDPHAAWELPGGTRLHATGSWTYSPWLCGPTAEQSLFWPGTLTWVVDDHPPERRELLHDHSHEDLRAALRRNRDL